MHHVWGRRLFRPLFRGSNGRRWLTKAPPLRKPKVALPFGNLEATSKRKMSLAHEVITRPLILLLALVLMGGVVAMDYLTYGYLWMVSRVVRFTLHVAKIAGYYSFMEWGVTDPVDRVVVRSRCHEVAAHETMSLFLELGGVYIKMGQLMSTLTHLLPLEWCIHMKPCLDHASTMSIIHLVQQFQLPLDKGGLLGSPDELYRDFNLFPVKAASLAQVHSARGRGDVQGKKLAIKVQYRDLDMQMWGDLFIIEKLAGAVEWAFPNFDFRWAVSFYRKVVEEELDFLREADNCNRFRENFKNDPYVTAPVVYKKLSNSKILTMDFVDGFNVDCLDKMKEHGVDPEPVARRVAEVIAVSIFKHGFVHADPHPANIFVQPFVSAASGMKTWRLQWLDHGLYQELSEDFRLKYADLWVGLGLQDRDHVAKACRALGVENWELLSTLLTSRAHVTGTAREGVLSKDDFFIPYSSSPQMALGMLEVLRQVPPEMVLVLKCNDLLRSVQSELQLPVNYFEILSREAMKYLNEHRVRGLTGRALAKEVAEGEKRLARLHAALTPRS
eukprot:Sspe_Gene.34765::Locus_16880_Transcript_1_3_Confidence_0.500_Length_1879::g.34765::m.34765/K08869/ADCK, ABC1; aarF domain-containing kinase